MKKIRTKLQLSQVEFARRIGRSLATVRLYETGAPVPPEVQQRIDALSASPGAPDQSNVATLPHPFADLSDDQVWIVSNLIEILKQQPQGAIYRSLAKLLDEAISDWRKTWPSASTKGTTRKRVQHVTIPGGKEWEPLSSLESVCFEQLLRVLRCGKPGLPDAIISNLAQFSEFADLYESGAATHPAARHEASEPGRAGNLQSQIDALAGNTSAIGSGISAARRSLDDLGKAGEGSRPGEKSHPVPPRKRSGA